MSTVVGLAALNLVGDATLPHMAASDGKRPATPPRRGRPPDPDLEERTFAAALEEYARTGWAGFTIDAVARQARVGKASIYSRWPTKQLLLIAAMRFGHLPAVRVDSGSLIADLTELGLRAARLYLGPTGMAYLRIQVEAKMYPDVLGAEWDRQRRAAIHIGRKVVVDAIARGELSDGTSPAQILDALVGSLVFHILAMPAARLPTFAASPASYIEATVVFVLRGAGWIEQSKI